MADIIHPESWGTVAVLCVPSADVMNACLRGSQYLFIGYFHQTITSIYDTARLPWTNLFTHLNNQHSIKCSWHSKDYSQESAVITCCLR